MSKKIKYEEYGNYGKFISGRMSGKSALDDELTPLEALEQLSKLVFIYGGADQYKIIETALKNYQELVEKPCVIVGRTHGHTEALIDKICKNYKEVKITNLEDEKKIKALEIIKEKQVQVADLLDCISNEKADYVESGLVEYNGWHFEYRQLSQEEYELLKEVLKDE